MRSNERLRISEVLTNVIVAERHRMWVVFKTAKSSIVGFLLNTILNMEAYDVLPLSIACAENIALLHFLHIVPAQPSSKDVRQLIGNGSSTQSERLPLKQEAQFTGILSMLSALRENVRRVTAVAVRELPHPETLEVLIAVNKATPTAGDAYMQEIKASFECYFKIISKATSASDTALDLLIFQQILIRCQDRILSRLRFKKQKRGKQKPAIQKSLQQLSNAVSTLKGKAAHIFIQETRKLVASLESFSNHRVIEKLRKVVEDAYTWNKMGDMSKLFESIPSKVLAPDMYPALRSIVAKIGQYQAAARKLCRLARDFPVLRNPKVTTVKLPATAFARNPTDQYVPRFDATLKRIEGRKYEPGLFARLCHIMGESPEDCQSAFTASVNQTLEEPKIHAEIQILAYLIYAVSGGPRMLKSHGRLYNTWRLPLLMGLKDLHMSLNNALEDQARASISLLLQKRRKIGYSEPYESSALSASTAISRAIEVHKAPCIESKQRENRKKSPARPKSENMQTAPIESFEGKPRRPSSGTSCNISVDQSLSRIHSMSLDAGQTSLVYESRCSKLWVEFTVGPHYPEPRQPLLYSIRSLGIDDTLRLRQDPAIEIQDVASMEPGSEIVLPLKPSYFLDFGDGIVEVINI
ncbi:hypothetical protein NUW58_g3288 [Xylaria curta]|uniref:Uncharacterized protein n=1 Tax=Xylaria curta TaxID=42375 RepID=A0ACC1PCW2_9PEZI|nr:hypothetical protein NUW58_g3288 [Xylaria curta]